MNVQEVFRLLTLAQGEQKLVQHHLADRIARTMATRDHSHWQVAVSRQGGLHDWKADRNAANGQRAGFEGADFGGAGGETVGGWARGHRI